MAEEEGMGSKPEQGRDAQREEKVANAALYFTEDLTVAGANFFRSHLELVRFIGFVGELATRNDRFGKPSMSC